ncbi:MAG: acetyl ornithine aminotransferase family protein [Candidatus Bathyarchaeota archaeon]|nr:acetyl ornithine aminotransferase family protein [Candidatus Bathyarchaeota archaeon]MDH5532042.1 acetyl ornithine aminotransferase family protein [Candidatus Bathyarchaeota archaeon]MDH5712896.1 acetyl ornithine aminotransferase family protein [Candidatus Bathyarchaeota archaeon]
MTSYPKIVVSPPGPKARELIKKDETFISPSYARVYHLAIESGKGCIVKDVDGNEFIDFNSGLVCLNVGHCHPKVVDAIKKQSEKFLHYSNTDFYYRPAMNLAEKLCEVTPGRFDKRVYFGNSGAEAVEAAVKLSKWHTRKHRFIAYISAFHGRTLGALSLTASKPVQRRYFFPMLPGVTHVPYPNCYRCPFKLSYPDCNYWCVDFIDEMVLQKYVPPEEVAGILIEPIQGEGGYVVPPPEYFPRLKRIADKYGLLMIDDEIQAGVGRTGRWFAIEHWKVEPDVVCIAKAIASGLPLGAIVSRARLMDWEGGSHASTFGGNPLSCAAALALIDVVTEEKLLENAAKQGRYITKRLENLKDECEILGDVRGKGLMIGAEIVEDKNTKKPAKEKASKIMLRCWKRGIAIITCGVSTLRIAPPLIITRELVDAAMDIVEDVFREVDKEK